MLCRDAVGSPEPPPSLRHPRLVPAWIRRLLPSVQDLHRDSDFSSPFPAVVRPPGSRSFHRACVLGHYSPYPSRRPVCQRVLRLRDAGIYIMHVAAWSLMLVFLPPVRYWVAPLIARRCGSRRVFLCPFQDLLHELVAFRLSRMVNYFWHKHLTLAALAKGLYLGML